MKNKIVCLSTTSFHPLPTRKQNVMTRLKNSEILYFDPPVSFLAPLKDKTAWKKLFNFTKAGQKVQDNITVYSMPPVIPFFNKMRFINKINQFFASIYVKSRMKKHNFGKDSVLWCYSPASCDIVKHLSCDKLVYDCVDRHSAYKGMINVEVVDGQEKDLATGADMVFCTAVGLEETLKTYNDKVHMIPNGAAYELFSKAHFEKFDIPQELVGVQKPIYGFVGMLQECIDYDLIEMLAKTKPDSTIIFIGRTLPGVDVDYLKKYPNIIFKGLIPQKELPAYIASFDVCLNVFRKGSLSRDVSPLKFYEYLSTGKPVVSTREPLQVADFADCIYISDNTEGFLENCEKALMEKTDEFVKKRMLYGKECSWDARVLQIEKILKAENIL